MKNWFLVWLKRKSVHSRFLSPVADAPKGELRLLLLQFSTANYYLRLKGFPVVYFVRTFPFIFLYISRQNEFSSSVYVCLSAIVKFDKKKSISLS